jgi:lipopolysaccharide transport system ATP-binding protein
MRPILEVQHVSKKFAIGNQQLPYLSFRDKLLGMFRANASTEDFWALQDVSFEVKQGEPVAIIGRNGAGKSTLLKILSRITPPSQGKVYARGRIASLLEVGTGFHPELTGRENIFMNGSILGMKQAEIKARFDEIVEFSGTARFLDTSLKHYSSGMQLRLAFAVAAHLDPEILIIDEVLAVGDAEFQKKCLGKMKDVEASGRTILFVSHHMGMVKQLCTKGIWLDKGKIKLIGDAESVVNSYLQAGTHVHTSLTGRHLGKGVSIENLSFDNNPAKSLYDSAITFELRSEQALQIDSIGFFLNNLLEERVAIIDLRKGRYNIRPGKTLKFEVDVKKIPMIEGEYRVGLFLGSTLLTGNFEDLITLQVENARSMGDGDLLPYPVEVRGKMEIDYNFHVETT